MTSPCSPSVRVRMAEPTLIYSLASTYLLMRRRQWKKVLENSEIYVRRELIVHGTIFYNDVWFDQGDIDYEEFQTRRLHAHSHSNGHC